MFTALLVIPVLVFFFYHLYYSSTSWSRTRGLSLPPGPKRKWIIGNAHQISQENFQLQTIEWAKLYGPIFHIQIPTKHIVFLNSSKVVLDLLKSRSSIYSERPKLWMIQLAARNRSIFNTSFSDPRFKILRKLLQDGLNPRAVKSYRPIQVRENQVLLKALANSPNDFLAHIRRNAVAIIMNVAYGYQVTSNDDPLVHLIEDALKTVKSISVPGKFFVEFFPLLRFLPSWFPGAGFKRYAESTRKKLARIDDLPFDWAKEEIRSGNYIESFTSRHLYEEGLNSDPEKQDYIKRASSALYFAGSETIVSALTTFLLIMAKYPEVQRRAQVDIDRLAPSRLPTLDDYDALPYIRAIIREIMRFGPPTSLTLPHCLMKDDIYENYFIPKDAIVIGSIWSITHDEDLYPNPFCFDPSRHLGENPQPDPLQFIFGFGRRVCPGAHLAEMSMFLNMTTILAVFNILKPLDAEGKEFEPNIEWIHGLNLHLKPFACRIQPRSDERLELVDA